MTLHDDRTTDLERALKEAYLFRSDAAPDVDVTQAVMREIRRSGNASIRWGPAALLKQLVWRTATITAAVVLVATMLTVGLLRTPAADGPSVVVEDFEPVPLFG